MPPHLAEAFRLLRRGRHICRDNVRVFRDLKQHRENYTMIFAALGYDLHYHPQDFFFLSGEHSLTTKSLQAAALFVFILFQDLEDKKFQSETRQWQATLTTRSFTISELPHFATGLRRRMMTNVGVDEDNLRDVISTLRKLGMLEMLSSGTFQFRSPIYRFIDLCLEMAERDDLILPAADDDSKDFI